jgi:hypothetical protein
MSSKMRKAYYRRITYGLDIDEGHIIGSSVLFQSHLFQLLRAPLAGLKGREYQQVGEVVRVRLELRMQAGTDLSYRERLS